MTAPEIDEVSELSDDAVVDPHWQELLHGSALPSAYLPAAMSGPHKPWLRVASAVLVTAFLGATSAGICLTYGPHLSL